MHFATTACVLLAITAYAAPGPAGNIDGQTVLDAHFHAAPAHGNSDSALTPGSAPTETKFSPPLPPLQYVPFPA